MNRDPQENITCLLVLFLLLIFRLLIIPGAIIVSATIFNTSVNYLQAFSLSFLLELILLLFNTREGK